MKDLDKKYRENNLTLEELSELREKINNSSDNDIEELLFDAWNNEEASDFNDMDKIKRRIDDRILPKKNRFQLYFNWAAAILILCLFSASIYFYQRSNVEPQIVTVTTGKGEKANVKLPDGTVIHMNYESQLSYNAADFNTAESRTVNFRGEGFFKVYKNAECPFVVSMDYADVKVLGTTFNLLSRDNSEIVQVSLEEGCVEFSPKYIEEKVTLKPGEYLVLNNKYRTLSVNQSKRIDKYSSWRNGYLEFSNSRLGEVLKEIENVYGFTINTNLSVNDTDVFTGMISTSNLYEALNVLEMTYDLKAKINGNIITLIQK